MTTILRALSRPLTPRLPRVTLVHLALTMFAFGGLLWTNTVYTYVWHHPVGFWVMLVPTAAAALMILAMLVYVGVKRLRGRNA